MIRARNCVPEVRCLNTRVWFYFQFHNLSIHTKFKWFLQNCNFYLSLLLSNCVMSSIWYSIINFRWWRKSSTARLRHRISLIALVHLANLLTDRSLPVSECPLRSGKYYVFRLLWSELATWIYWCCFNVDRVSQCDSSTRGHFKYVCQILLAIARCSVALSSSLFAELARVVETINLTHPSVWGAFELSSSKTRSRWVARLSN